MERTTVVFSSLTFLYLFLPACIKMCIRDRGGSERATRIYRWLYILAVLIGPYLSVEAVWNLADITNGLMAFPNLIALYALSGVVIAEVKTQERQRKRMLRP